MPTQTQNQMFTKFLINVITDELENALHGTDWQDLVNFILEHFDPEDIFPVEYLSIWATENGYRKEQ